MKVRKKQSNNKVADMLTDFEDKTKHCFVSIDELDSFNTVEQLDIMDISVSNFQFASFNKLELESLDIINEENSMAKEEYFPTIVADFVNSTNKDMEETNSLEGLVLSRDVEESHSIPQKENTNFDEGTPKLSKRALKRKKRLEESKLQCSVRTTARHYTKMFEFLRQIRDWLLTWSDYKLHLRKKLSGIKRSGKALDVPNQFNDQDTRALSNIGVSLCVEDTTKIAIKKRFNPEPIESEDSSSHSTVQSSTQNFNIPHIYSRWQFFSAKAKICVSATKEESCHS
ncbi:hypothetical protein NQ317_011847 [Molorchus minor]|uniref:Uncharacterized protein n=1 Tax=Molorchus minor TaxID=1323400 RepID=A0ABQ9JNM6_9CUCU|nr:hypothetical protein NQ317_011847 [Molorchus minor]